MRPLFRTPPIEQIRVPEWFRGFNPVYCDLDRTGGGYRRHLPHWRYEGATYFLTFRLGDAVPESVARTMRREVEEWKDRMNRERLAGGGHLSSQTVEQWEQFQRERFRRMEGHMDSGHGSCVLRNPRARLFVEKALHHFEGERCRMGAFAIMPNHVHAVCQPVTGITLEDLAGSWKRFSAEAINSIVGRQGRLWQHESFDRIVRDGDHYRRVVRYVIRNPEKARLHEDQAAVWMCGQE